MADAERADKLGSAEAATTIARMHASIRSVSSIQFVTHNSHVSYKDSRKVRELRSSFSCAIEGNKFRAESELNDNITGKSHKSTIAFNGDRYQQFNNSTSSLELVSKPPKSTLSQVIPITLPYFFIYSHDDHFDYATLANTPNWDIIARTAKIVGNLKVNNQECNVIEVIRPQPTGALIFRIYAAPGLENLPLEYDISGPDYAAKMKTHEYKIVETERGRVVLATNTKLEEFDGKSNLVAETTSAIDLDTLIVNHDIPDAFFTLDKSLAKIIVDGDEGKVIRQAGAIEPKNKSWRLGLILLNGFVVLVLLTFFIFRRFRQPPGL